MDQNEQRQEQQRVVVDRPGERREVITERTETGGGSGPSAGTIAIIAVVAIAAIGIVVYLVTNRSAEDAANRNANLDVASQTNQPPPTTIVQQPAPAQQAPIIIQQPAPAQQAPVIIQQPAEPSRRDGASADANMQELATRKLAEEPEMTAVSVSISEANAVLTGTVNSEAIKAKAERLVKEVRGVKSVDNKIVVSQ